MYKLFSFIKNPKNSTCAVYGYQYNLFKVKLKLNSSLVNMECDDVAGPPKLHGMKVMDKDAFRKVITLPCLEIESDKLKTLSRVLEKHFFKFKKMKTFQTVNGKHRIFLNPHHIQKWTDLDESVRSECEKLNVTNNNFSNVDVELSYDNWSAPELLKSVLPSNEPPLTSYSIIGHIIHLNIKEHLLDYKNIIAEILYSKNEYIKTVVRKKNIIGNVYRNFEMEVLCGEPDFVTTVKEYGHTYKFDFSKVYWNPRLSTEHERIVSKINQGDVLFDIFAGVGPFAIPAAAKKCMTYANDLNPDSYKWLNHNITLNKKSKQYIKTFNKDGSDFILNDVREILVKTWQDSFFCGKIYCIMNLPATALTFINYFKSLIAESDIKDLDLSKINECLPIVHCHFFAKEEEKDGDVFETSTGINLKSIEHKFQFVRKVSSAKRMMRITFHMPIWYLLAGKNSDVDKPLAKKVCSNL